MSISSRRERRNERNGLSNFVPTNIEEVKYQEALRRVKKIKGFYTHLIVYVFINIAILIANYPQNGYNETFWRWETLSTPLFWGIGLAAHGLSVFLPSFIIGKDWEERKINQLMEKEKQNKWE